jgi:hydroxymethylpyrimidine/phosphomethylpyrimidine kinase
MIKTALTIAGSDSGGGAGIQADLKTFCAFGVYGMSVLTSITAQNTQCVLGIHDLPARFVSLQLEAVLTDIGADAAKTGMLSNSGIIRAVCQKIRQHRLGNLVVDPVMVAKSGDQLLREDARETLKRELLPLATVVTPNLPEAGVLSGKTISTRQNMRDAARIIFDLGSRYVLIKGGHLKGKAVDILYDGDTFAEFESKRIHTRHTHGTGCTFSAAIAAGLALGRTVPEAVAMAKKYISLAIEKGLPLGGGHGPLNHMVHPPSQP